MEKNKMNKLDMIFVVGIGVIAILSALIDCFYTKVFPVFSIGSVYYVSYPLLIVLLIYSSLKYKEKQDKPKYVRWFMCFILPFFTFCVNSKSNILFTTMIFILIIFV